VTFALMYLCTVQHCCHDVQSPPRSALRRRSGHLQNHVNVLGYCEKHLAAGEHLRSELGGLRYDGWSCLLRCAFFYHHIETPFYCKRSRSWSRNPSLACKCVRVFCIFLLNGFLSHCARDAQAELSTCDDPNRVLGDGHATRDRHRNEDIAY
jgi:hypothetical protein